MDLDFTYKFDFTYFFWETDFLLHKKFHFYVFWKPENSILCTFFLENGQNLAEKWRENYFFGYLYHPKNSTKANFGFCL